MSRIHSAFSVADYADFLSVVEPLSVLPPLISSPRGRCFSPCVEVGVAFKVLTSLFIPLFRYGTLQDLGEKRKDMLEKSCKKFMLFREANELQQWINEKESALTNEEVGSDLEQVEVLQKKFDDFQKVCFSYTSVTHLSSDTSIGLYIFANSKLFVLSFFVFCFIVY